MKNKPTSPRHVVPTTVAAPAVTELTQVRAQLDELSSGIARLRVALDAHATKIQSVIEPLEGGGTNPAYPTPALVPLAQEICTASREVSEMAGLVELLTSRVQL